MGNPQVAFDSALFMRAASLFVVKRAVFPPDKVEALAGHVLQHLSSHRPPGAQCDIPVIGEDSVAAFCAALIEPEPDAALRFIEARRAEGMTRMGVYLGYVCAAARHLGEAWDRDEMSFIDVTTGTGHLYALMRAMRAERPVERGVRDARRSALFATVPGESHGIGISVAADVFCERGWQIDLQIGLDHDEILERVERTQPGIIGLSLSTEARFDALARLVLALRLVVPQSVIGVAPGEGIDAARLPQLVDIDLVFDSAMGACADLERLIAVPA